MCLMWCLDNLSMAFSISDNPFSCLIAFVEKQVFAPVPFQSPYGLGQEQGLVRVRRNPDSILQVSKCQLRHNTWMGLGSMDTTTPNSSATRWIRNLASHKSSPIKIPSQGPIWNSHWKYGPQAPHVQWMTFNIYWSGWSIFTWAGMTSALAPLIFTPV